MTSSESGSSAPRSSAPGVPGSSPPELAPSSLPSQAPPAGPGLPGASAAARALPRRRRLPRWRFWFPLALQLMLILPIPLRNTYTVLAGETLLLQTLPVDPYDLLRGYSQTLSYDISDIETIADLPGGEFLQAYRRSPKPFYLVFAPPAEVDRPGPADWQPSRVSLTRPESSVDERFIQAFSEGSRIRYNLERFYMPEEQREDLNRTIEQLQRQNPQALQVEIKVDRFGGAVPVALLLGGDRHAF